MNPNDFNLSPDFPLDKVIYQLEYSVTLAPFGFKDDYIPHGLSFEPLMSAQWSTSPSFTTAYNISGGPLVAGQRSYETGIGSISGTIHFSTFNRTASTVTLYFKSYGLMPSNVNSESPFTDIDGDAFVMNTDYNYTKLLLSGIESLPSSSPTRVINHNLGYVPQVSCWVVLSGEVSPYVFNLISNDFYSVSIDEQSLRFKSDTLSSPTFHYRIYADRQTL